MPGSIMIPSTASGALAAVSPDIITSKRISVDLTNGDDSDATKPFKSCTAARSVAVSGDTIYVGGGTVTERNLLKDGVDWDIDGDVDYTGTVAGSIFDNTSSGVTSAVTCRIRIAGAAKQRNSSTNAPSVCYILAMNNRSSNIYLEAGELIEQITASAGFSANAGCIRHCGGTLRVNVPKLTVNATSSVAYWWHDGPSHLKTSLIVVNGTNGKGVYASTADGEGDLDNTWISGDLHTHVDRFECNAVDSYAQYTVDGNVGTTAATTARVWMHTDETFGVLGYHSLLHNGFRGYYTVDKANNDLGDGSGSTISTITINGGYAEVTAQKVTGAGNTSNPTINLQSGTSVINIGHLDQPNSVGHTMIKCLAGDHVVTVSKTTPGAALVNGVNVTGGSLILSGRIDTSGATGAVTVNVTSGATCILTNASLLAATAKDCVNVSAANTKVTIEGGFDYNTTINANVVLDWTGWRAPAVLATQFDSTNSSTLATATGLQFRVPAGKTVEFEALLHVTADAVGGWKTAIGGTCSATTFISQTEAVSDTSNALAVSGRDTTKGNSQSAAIDATYFIWISGVIVVNATGTLLVQFSQKTATPATTSSILVGSLFRIRQTN